MRTIKVFFVLFFIGLMPAYSFAASGACSWHGGVSCSVSKSIGKVICNDGWEDSSVRISDVQACWEQQTPNCYYPGTGYMCRTDEDYTKKKSQMCAVSSLTGADGCKDPGEQETLQRCKDDIEKYKNAMSQYDSCIKDFYYKPPSANSSVEKRLEESREKLEEAERNFNASQEFSVKQSRWFKKIEECQANHGDAATLDFSKFSDEKNWQCVCKSGYSFINGVKVEGKERSICFTNDIVASFEARSAVTKTAQVLPPPPPKQVETTKNFFADIFEPVKENVEVVKEDVKPKQNVEKVVTEKVVEIEGGSVESKNIAAEEVVIDKNEQKKPKQVGLFKRVVNFLFGWLY